MRLLYKYNFLFSSNVSNSLKQFLFLVGFLFVSFNGYSQVTVAFSAAAISGEEASGTMPIFLVSGNVTSPSTVEIDISSASAVSGEDYTITNTIINIPLGNYANNTPFTIGIDILDDFIEETDEVLDLEIIAVSGDVPASFVGNQLSYTIINDDFAGINVDTFVGTTSEDGDTAEFLFTLTSEPTDDVRIIINRYDATETRGPSEIRIVPENWNTGFTLIVTGVDDAIYDGNIIDGIRTGNVISNDVFYDPLANGNVPDLIITNLDNEVPTVSITTTTTDAAAATAAENTSVNDTGLFTINIGAPNPNTAALVVNYSISGSAVNGADYATIQESVSVLSGQQFATVLIEPVDDAIVEGDESVTLTLLPDTAYDLNPIPASQTANVNIEDNDTGVISLSFTGSADFNAAEEASDTGRINIATDKANGTAANVNVEYTVSGSATNIDDYVLTNTVNLLFQNNETTVLRAIFLVPVDDDLIEGEETFVITLIRTDSPLFTIDQANNIATITIADNDICAGGDTAPTINNNSTSFCDINSINLNDFIVGGTESAPSGSVLRWSTIANPISSADLIATSVVSTSDKYYAVYWDDLNECASPSSEVNVVFSISPNIDVDDNAAACNNPNNNFGPISVNLNLFSTGSDAGVWAFTTGPTNIAPNGNDVVNFRNQTAGTYVYTYTTNTAIGICSDQSFTVTIEVDNCDPCTAGFVSPALNTETPTLFCDDIDVSLNDYVNDTPPAGTTLEWSNFSDIEDPDFRFLDPEDIASPSSGTVFGFFWDPVNNCVSPAREITIVLNMSPVITDTTGGERCGSGSVDFTVTGNTPDAGQPPTFNWFASDDLNDTVILDSGTTFSIPNISTSTTFYVSATADNCTSVRVPVLATIFPAQSAGTPSDTSSCSNPDNGPTTVDLDDRLTGASAGVWTITSDPSNTLTIDDSNTVNFNNRPDGNYVFTFTTTGAEGPCVNESATVTISVNDCDVDTDLDGLFDGVEAVLGTDPNNEDTDGDSINDADEVGDDINNPIDTDEDGIIDALESNVLDQDSDGIVDQLDPANDNPCLPNRFNGACDTDGDGISDLDEQTNGSDADDPCSPNATADCDTAIDLEVLKSVDNENVALNEQAVFTITVNNLSDRLVKDVLIGELLESGFEYVDDNASQGTYNQQTGIWDIDEIQPLQTITLEITVTIIADGIYTNTAELLQSFPIDATTANNSATVNVNLSVPTPAEVGIVFNQFSPNADEVNDMLRINRRDSETGLDVSIEYSITIFDRYGNEVFEAQNKNESDVWDGTYKGKQVPNGTYFYILNINVDNSDAAVRKGWIQLIR